LSEVCRRILIVDIVTLAIVALGLGHLFGSAEADAGAWRGNVADSPVENPEYSPPRPSCFAGGVSLGPRAGAIDFWARCRPTAASGHIGLSVSRATPDELQLLPLKAFRRFPLLQGSGDVRRGWCVRARRSNGGGINCGARIKGSAVLRGRVWVGVEGRCAGDIRLISAPSYEPCRGVCASVLPGTTRIASGAPRGC
jgi:hypothetical protein